MTPELYNVPLEDWLDQRFKEILPARTLTYSRRPDKQKVVKRWMARQGYAIITTNTHVLITRKGQVLASRPLDRAGAGGGKIIVPGGAR